MDDRLELKRATQARQDFIDEQRESVGLSNKMYRFHRPENIPGTPQHARKENGPDSFFRRWWDSMTREQRIQHLRYRMDLLALELSDQIDEARRDDERAAKHLQELRDRAAELEDGTKVYRTEDRAAAYTDDGQALTDEQRNAIDWQNRPTWEDRVRAGENRRLSSEKLERLESLNDRLNRHREALDTDNLTDDDLADICDDLDAIGNAVRPEKSGLSKRFSSAHDDLRECNELSKPSRSLTPDVSIK